MSACHFKVQNAMADVHDTFLFRRVLIILDLTVLATGSEMKGKIGSPVQFTEGNAGAGTAASSGSNPNQGGGRPLRGI